MNRNSNQSSALLVRCVLPVLLAALLPGAAAATPLRVVTYNIHGGHGNLAGNLTTFRDTMLAGEDVLCLQEVPVGGDWNTVKTIFAAYPHTFQTINTTTKWIWPWQSQQQNSVAILSKHPFQFTHSKLIQIDPGGDKWERHAQHVRIDPGTGPVDLFNFHNTYNWFNNDYQAERAGLVKFRDYVAERLGVATPADADRLVMAGDFNVLADKVAAILSTPSHVGNGLDHVCSVLPFTSQGVYGTYGAGLSDHNAVWAVANAWSGTCDMLSFTVNGMAGMIDGTNITVTVPFGTGLTTLAPSYTMSDAATGVPASGTRRDFTTPQTYTITAGDGVTNKTYTVTVCRAAQPGVVATLPPELAPGDPYRLVFVTSTRRDATAQDIGAYNAFVSNTAAASPALDALATTWTCLGSAGDRSSGTYVNANQNTLTRASDPSAPIYRLDGLRVAAGNSALWDGSLDNPIAIDESGDVLSTKVWTGTRSDGTRGGDWFLGDTGGGWAYYGLSNGTGSGGGGTAWVDNLGEQKMSQYACYAISGILTAPAANAYPAWAAANSNWQPAAGDANHNGIPNGIEYLMGATAANPATLPMVAESGGTWTWTLPYDPAATDATWKFQVSANLTNWTDYQQGDPEVAVFTGPDELELTLPAAATGKRFARLVVSIP